MTQSHPAPRETPAQYAERHRQRANDGRPDRVVELAADIEAHVQAAKWSLDLEQAHDLARLVHHDGVPISGDHRPQRVG